MIRNLPIGPPRHIAALMIEDISALILKTIERAPQWLRHDLLSKDAVTRSRAEETLAAMIVDTLPHGTAGAAEG